jgi:hypothetical protein
MVGILVFGAVFPEKIPSQRRYFFPVHQGKGFRDHIFLDPLSGKNGLLERFTVFTDQKLIPTHWFRNDPLCSSLFTFRTANDLFPAIGQPVQELVNAAKLFLDALNRAFLSFLVSFHATLRDPDAIHQAAAFKDAAGTILFLFLRKLVPKIVSNGNGPFVPINQLGIETDVIRVPGLLKGGVFVDPGRLKIPPTSQGNIESSKRLCRAKGTPSSFHAVIETVACDSVQTILADITEFSVLPFAVNDEKLFAFFIIKAKNRLGKPGVAVPLDSFFVQTFKRAYINLAVFSCDRAGIKLEVRKIFGICKHMDTFEFRIDFLHGIASSMDGFGDQFSLV